MKRSVPMPKITAIALVLLVMGMIGVSYAAVPLYDLFCRVTGYAGTPNVAVAIPDRILNRSMTVRFNADVHRGLPWNFRATHGKVTVKVGEPVLAFYKVENTSDRAVIGTATYNVTPLKVGRYFSKIDCFCFTEQVLAPGEVANLPVSFFVDPSIMDDPEMDKINTITLSYTFFEVETQEQEQLSSAGRMTSPTVN